MRIIILIVLVGCILPQYPAGGGEMPIVSINEGSCRFAEFFCYRTKVAEKYEVHLVKCGVGKVEVIFSRQVSSHAHAPICFQGGVIVTETDGKVSKYDNKGNLMFANPLKDFNGASKFGYRLNDRLIFVERTWFRQTGAPPTHELLVVDVAGKEPVTKARIQSEQIAKITRVGNEFFGIGPQKAWKLELPQTILNEINLP